MVFSPYPLKRVPPQKTYCNNGHMGLARCNLVRVRHCACSVSLVSSLKGTAMNSTSGFHEGPSSTSRSPSPQFLHEQRHRFRTDAWHRLHTDDFIALSTSISTKRKTIPDTNSVSSHPGTHRQKASPFFLGFILVNILLATPLAKTYAQDVPITPSGLHTLVSDPIVVGGQTQYDITGGTRPGGGVNLFHSFGDFNVPTNNIANFLNAGSVDVNGTPLLPNLLTDNIFGRVTEQQDPSMIFGMIQTNGPGGFEHANLFLMNPHGFLFGPTATVNVGGMAAFTSADYLRLADNTRFNAIPNPAADALLTALPVASFGFLGTNPGAITVQGSQFTVADGRSISLIGGNISIESGTPDGGTSQPARLSAPNGKIQLASAASPGEFDAATLQAQPNMDGTSFTSFGSVTLASGSTINISGTDIVSIKGGQFVLSMNEAVLSTAQSPGPPETISFSPSSSIISSNAGPEPGADVQLIASNVQMDGASIQSLTTGEGTGGNISITAALDGGPISSTAGSVQIKGGQIQTVSLGPGTVGDIQINSSSLSMTDGALIDTLLVPNPLIPGQPGGGTIAITATDSIFVTGQRLGTTTLLPSVPGLPTFTNLPSGIYSENVSANTGSSIVIQTPSLTLQPGLIDSHTFGAGAGGDVSLLLGQLTLKDGGLITSNTFGAGAGASLQIRASDSITMSGFLPGAFQFGPVVLQDVGSNIANVTYGSGQAGQVSVFTSTFNLNGANIASTSLGPGGAGDVNIQAATIGMTGGAVISVSTLGSGPGGTVSVTASEQLSISGRSGRSLGFGSFTAVNNPSAITAMTLSTGRAGAITVSTPSLIMFDGGLISTATGGDSPAGSITVNAGMINVNSGASISSSSGFNVGVGGFLVGNGAGGTVTVNATGPVTIADQGSGIFTDTQGAGAGGNIFVNADSVTLQNGGTLSATTSGLEVTATGGTITVEGNTVQLNSGGTITAQSTGSGNAGNITVQGLASPAQSVFISGFLDENFNPVGGISTETQGTGAAGTINISANEVRLADFASLSARTSGSGDGGSVTIHASLFTSDSSLITGETTSVGNAGNISIVTTPVAGAIADEIRITDSSISTNTFGDGNAGTILLQTTGNLSVSGSEILSLAEPDVTQGFIGGRAGTIQLLAGQDVSLTNSFVTVQTSGNQSGGEILLTGNSLYVEGASLNSLSVPTEGLQGGDAGDIRAEISETSRFFGSSVTTTTSGSGNAGNISLTTGILSLEDSSLSSSTSPIRGDLTGGNGGNILLKADHMTVSGNSLISSMSDNSVGRAGNVTVIATESIQLLGSGTQPNTITTSSSGTAPSCSEKCGDAGTISITAHTLTLDRAGLASSTTGDGNAGSLELAVGTLTVSNGSQLSAGTSGSGAGGNISINATDSVVVSNPAEVVGHVRFSGIFTDTQGTGAGGNIFVNANSVTLQNGGTLSAATSGTAPTATGGTITVHANQVQLNDQATITANSTHLTDKPNTGAANAGAITVTAKESIVLLGNSSITSSAEAEGNGGLVSLTAPSIELHGNSTIGTSTAGLGNAGTIVLQGNQVNLLTESVVTARTQAEGRGGNITIRGLTGEGSRATDVSLSGKSQVRSQTVGDGEHVQGAAGNILVETARLNLSGGSLLITGSLGSTGAAGNITMNATDSLTISGVDTQLNSQSVDFSFGDAGHISISAPSVVIENSGHITSSTGLVGNAGTITVNTNDLQLLSGGYITSSSLAEVPELSSGAAGTVTIQGLASSAQSVFIDGPGSGIFTDTQGTGAGGNISIDASQFALSNRATLSAQTAGSGNAGNITVMASSFSMSERALISAGTGMGTTGHGGNISVQADEVLLTDNAGITTNTLGSGDAGAVAMTALDRISLTDSRMNSSTFAFPGKPEGGHGGQITLHAPTIDISNGQIVSLSSSSGNAGNVLLETVHLTLDASELTASAFRSGNSGDITIRGLTDTGNSARQVSFMGASQVLSETANTGNGGTIAIQTAQFMMQDNSLISTSSQGEGTVGNAGNVILNAGQSLGVTSGSLIQSGSIALSEGNAGNITVTAPAITLDAGTISTTTEFAGSAGTVMIKTNSLTVQNGGQIASSSVIVEDIPAGSAGNITIQGQGLASPAQSVLIDGAGSGVFTDTQGTGAGGNIIVNANSVTLQNGGTLSAMTSGPEITATGGTITVDATNTITMNSASITASSTGVADAGSINITSLNGFTMQNSSIATQAGQGAGGGDIKVTTSPDTTVLLQNSKISASVADGRGGGGNISIDPQFVILQNSQILAQAAQGQGGAITIIANLFLSDANSIVNADSGSGVNGTITIQSPNAPVSGQIQPLGATPLQATSLLNQHCASLAGGQFSSFTVAGRGSLPTEPGSWLASPLYAAGMGTGEGLSGLFGRSGAQPTLLELHPTHQMNQIDQKDQSVLSLRQIAPAGFLTQAFAVDQTGCTS